MGGALEPALYTLPQPLGEKGGDGSDENAPELERDMQLAFEEQEKSSSAPTPGSLRPTWPLPQIEHGHDRDRTSCGRLEELERGLPLRSQDWEEI